VAGFCEHGDEIAGSVTA